MGLWPINAGGAARTKGQAQGHLELNGEAKPRRTSAAEPWREDLGEAKSENHPVSLPGIP